MCSVVRRMGYGEGFKCVPCVCGVRGGARRTCACALLLVARRERAPDRLNSISPFPFAGGCRNISRAEWRGDAGEGHAGLGGLGGGGGGPAEGATTRTLARSAGVKCGRSTHIDARTVALEWLMRGTVSGRLAAGRQAAGGGSSLAGPVCPWLCRVTIQSNISPILRANAVQRHVASRSCGAAGGRAVSAAAPQPRSRGAWPRSLGCTFFSGADDAVRAGGGTRRRARARWRRWRPRRGAGGFAAPAAAGALPPTACEPTPFPCCVCRRLAGRALCTPAARAGARCARRSRARAWNVTRRLGLPPYAS
jgi:hypothetical protein